MAHASTVGASLNIDMPHVAVPKWRWPSPRAWAPQMIALMFGL